MRLPSNLSSLLEDGFIEAVLRPLQSGKEALVFLVVAEGEERVAKVYKEANDRNFKNRSEYAEGRGTRNTRDQRAMKRRSRHGKSRDEEAWRSTEVEMIHRLRNAGVRVPTPHMFMEGVLILELISGPAGGPAPRLGDIQVSPEEAIAIHDSLLRDVVRMLCAGVVHGDLSEFNVLLDPNGPVIIDLPQAVDASSNSNARKLLLRDVENLQRFVSRWVPGRKRQPFAAEMWALYEKNELKPETELTGIYKAPEGQADTDMVLSLIEDAKEDERWKRQSQRERTPVHTRRQPHAPSKRRKKKGATPSTPPAPAAPAPRSSLSDLVARANAPVAKKASPSKDSERRSSSDPARSSRRGRSEPRSERQPRQRGAAERSGERDKGADENSRGPRRKPASGTSPGPSGAPTPQGSTRPTRRTDTDKQRSPGSDAPGSSERATRSKKPGNPQSSRTKDKSPEQGQGNTDEAPRRRRRRRHTGGGEAERPARQTSTERAPAAPRTDPPEGRAGGSADSKPARPAPERTAGDSDAPPRKRRRRRRPSGREGGSPKPRSDPKTPR